MAKVLKFKTHTLPTDSDLKYFHVSDDPPDGTQNPVREGDIVACAVGTFMRGELHAVEKTNGEIYVQRIYRPDKAGLIIGCVVKHFSEVNRFPLVTAGDVRR